MSEANFWSTIRQRMHKKWDEATRHEDKLAEGIADVSFCCNRRHGWMELKQMDEWPKRPQTIVHLEHFTPMQKLFLKRKGKAGGNAWMFLKAERDYLLFYWDVVDQVGTLNKEGLFAIAWVWEKKMDWDELAQILGEG